MNGARVITKTGLCSFCAHARPIEGGLGCDAYPNGIPDEIHFGGLDHRQPLDGDGGITFEPEEGLTPVQLRAYMDRYEEDFPTSR